MTAQGRGQDPYGSMLEGLRRPAPRHRLLDFAPPLPSPCPTSGDSSHAPTRLRPPLS